MHHCTDRFARKRRVEVRIERVFCEVKHLLLLMQFFNTTIVLPIRPETVEASKIKIRSSIHSHRQETLDTHIGTYINW